MSELSDLLNQRITDNNFSISEINIQKPLTQKKIDLFGPVSVKIDSQALTIVTNIVELQNEIVNLSVAAYAVGCGTTGGAVTVYPDTVQNREYNLSSSTYVGNDPYDVDTSPLSSSNVGVGTFLVHKPNDDAQPGIGTLYGGISNCYRSTIFNICNSSNCVNYANQIAAKQNEIVTLRNQLQISVSDSNALKTQRLRYEIRRYGENSAIEYLEEDNVQILDALTAIGSNS